MENIPKILPGTILVSEPYLNDVMFWRSVILITDRYEDDVFGLILNKPTETQITDIITDFPHLNSLTHIGGPEDNETLSWIHCVPKIEDSIHLGGNIYFGGNLEQISFMVDTKQINKEMIRFYLGYSSWNMEGLMEDLEDGVLSVSSVEQIEDIGLPFFNYPEKMWYRVLKRMGGKYAQMADYPEDLSLN